MSVACSKKTASLEDFEKLPLDNFPSPLYITDEALLEENLKILASVKAKTQAKILLALKAFAQYELFDLIGRYLDGATASSVFEARLSCEELSKETHACAPAYPPEDFPELLQYVNHIVFNSFNQWHLFQEQSQAAASLKGIGMRINPEHSEVKRPLYDPCAPGSRLGLCAEEALAEGSWEGLNGLHFHSLCELGADALERTWRAVEKGFAHVLPQMRWINLGGGHHITRPDYDIELLEGIIKEIKNKYRGIEVYLEPGEAVALGCGVLQSRILDIVGRQGAGRLPVAILDCSATAHMPDVLEMPYRPQLFSHGRWAKEAGQYQHSYRLGGLSCLAGDIIGDYSFPKPLSIGQRLFFADMAHYTMVKNTNFNGIRTPGIAIANSKTGTLRLTKHFQYEDYKSRL